MAGVSIDVHGDSDTQHRFTTRTLNLEETTGQERLSITWHVDDHHMVHFYMDHDAIDIMSMQDRLRDLITQLEELIPENV